MGGICGFFGSFDRVTLDSMSSIMSHRGKKTFLHAEGSIGLSQRTPNFKNFNNTIKTPNGNFFILLDGDIFNKDGLLNLLKEKGYKLENTSDADVLIGLYLAF